jgi:hypothetical protein
MTTRVTIVLTGALGAGIMAAGIALDRPPDLPAKTHAVAAPQGARTALLHVRVFDGDRILPDATVVIDGDHIGAVGSDVAAPMGADLIDGAGKTLLPGFIDAHAHASGDALERAVVFGVTTELDMFADPSFAARARAEQSSHRITTRADLRSAGVLITAPGGHGTEFGQAIPTLAGPGDARSFVDARIAEGSDYIKIVKDDGSAYGLTWPTLDDEELAAVVAAAHWRQKLAVVHIGTQADAVAAIEAGGGLRGEGRDASCLRRADARRARERNGPAERRVARGRSARCAETHRGGGAGPQVGVSISRPTEDAFARPRARSGRRAQGGQCADPRGHGRAKPRHRAWRQPSSRT